VSAGGRAGACFGDSGGPLLVRGDDGHARVLGVLSSGAAGCFGRDTYARVDRLWEWLAGASGAPVHEHREQAGLGYAALGTRGRCFDGRAVWTEQHSLRARHCPPGEPCGWSDKADGYRCVKAGAACAGVSDLGQCEEKSAVRCVRGRIEQNPCGACGFSCAHSPQTGAAICTASQVPDGG
jgi:hypothetical protein